MRLPTGAFLIATIIALLACIGAVIEGHTYTCAAGWLASAIYSFSVFVGRIV